MDHHGKRARGVPNVYDVPMIAKIQGELESIADGRALVTLHTGLTYEVLVPAYVSARLAGSMGQAVTFHTLEFYESQGQGATMLPRLAGFLSPEDKAFYELFVTCKGIGYRRALRVMTLSTGQIAGAIADRDLATLQSLPEVGRRTAETIAVTLRDKVDRFAAADAMATAGSGGEAQTGGGGLGNGVVREALEALLQLGENRAQAMQWIDQAMAEDVGPKSAQEVLAAVYRIKGAG